jgi:hypothetical protein
VLTGWPALPKPFFINQRFGWLIIQDLLLLNQDLEDELQQKTASQTTLSKQANHNFFKSIQ